MPWAERVAHDERLPPAVILAAGEGRRLANRHARGPKPLRRVLGVTLAERCLAQLQAAGVDHFIVVLGHEADRVRSHFAVIGRRRRCHLTFVEAEEWRGGNGFSAAAAAPVVGDRFLLAMTDHLLSVEIVRRILATPPRAGEIVLAVDRCGKEVFDRDDLTKVRLADDRVLEIGKELTPWDAGDTGLFYCTRALFEGLDRARRLGDGSLTGAIRECVQADAVRTVDVTGLDWLDVDTPAAHQEATRRLARSLTKGREDGFVSEYGNRRVSLRLSALLARTALTPNQLSGASFALALLGAIALAAPSHGWWLVGGIAIQFASILDGCDGEIARLKLICSPRGAWLDTMLDRYADIALGIAVTVSAARANPSAAVWLGGFVAVTGFLLASYVTKEFGLRLGFAYPNTLVNRLKRRDLRILTVAVGAIVGFPYVALMAVGALAHGAVLHILMSGIPTRVPPQEPTGRDRHAQGLGARVTR